MFLSPQGMGSSQYGGGIVVAENCIINHGAFSPRPGFIGGSSQSTVGVTEMRWAHEAIVDGSSFRIYVAGTTARDVNAGGTETYGSTVNESQSDVLNKVHVITIAPNVPEKQTLPSPATWSACSFSGDTPTVQFSIVHQFKQRMYYAEGLGLSSKFYYTAVNAADGVLVSFDLAEFGGGGVVEIKSLTKDGGSGPDDFIVFFCENNTAFIYQGVDPGDSLDWSLVGKFFLPPPVNERCTAEVDGDIVYLSRMGMVSVIKSMGMSGGSYQPPDWAAPMNETFLRWLRLPNGSGGATVYKRSFVRSVLDWGLIMINPSGEVQSSSEAAEDLGPVYVYDTRNRAWYRWGAHRGTPTRFGDYRDVFPVYDPMEASTGDADRRDFDLHIVDVLKTGFMIIGRRQAGGVNKSRFDVKLEYGGLDVDEFAIHGSIMWANQPLEKNTVFTEARIDGVVINGTLDSISFHIGVNGGALEQQFIETTTGWEYEYKPISAQGNTIQARLDFKYTPALTANLEFRAIADFITPLQIFGIELLKRQAADL